MLPAGKLAESEALHRAALEGWRAVLGAGHDATLEAAALLATLLQAQGEGGS